MPLRRCGTIVVVVHDDVYFSCLGAREFICVALLGLLLVVLGGVRAGWSFAENGSE